ncbi:MAG: Tyrosine-protein kinase Wzc (EC [uncultured Thiotrichaceae bacterium]|uniref:non-specific protein-tyrosine kinase n=1 Tax=uncultured Thiotrichaceae bacterium TaxID=298394 RepID=A0A6S6U8Q4_9GAMM|nr:MAG: Tyrosine-protein kinase Wzc (EC [uncultured Thiotrichaceae bacterium]
MSTQYNSPSAVNAAQQEAQLTSLYPETLLSPSKGLNIREFWNTLVRNKMLLTVITVLAFIASLLFTLTMNPVYRASSTIQIESQSPKMVDVVFETTGRRPERDFWQTQIQLLQSNTIASSVMDELEVRDRFTSRPGVLSSLRSAPPSPESNFLKGLHVEPISNSQLVLIHFESGDPELSSQIVNTLAKTYIRSNLERQFESAKFTQDFLQKERDAAKTRMTESEKALDAFAQENNIVNLDNNQTTNSHIIKKLTEELVDAEKNSIELSNELQQLELAETREDPTLLLNTRSMQTLRNQLLNDENTYEEKKRRYGGKSRSARNAKKKITATMEKITAEALNYKNAISSQLESAKRSEGSLKEKLDAIRQETMAIQGSVHTYNNLKREVRSNQMVYENLVERIKEVGVAGGMDTNNISVVDPAIIPHNKFKPKLKTNVLFGTLIGFLLGIAAIFIREFMNDSITDAEELERITNLPMMGAIPTMKGRSDVDIAQQIISEPRSIIAESIRSLRTALSFSTQYGAPQTLFLTSSEPEEGKTSISMNLAAAYALAGENVLIIDGDLRNPSLDRLYKLDNRQGLSSYLTGKGNLSMMIQRTATAGLNVLVAGPLPPDPVELLSGKRLNELLHAARQDFDRIIIDGPPVLGLADALILANLADGTLLTVHADKTLKNPMRAALKRLRQARANLLGTLLNQATKIDSAYSYSRYEHARASSQTDAATSNTHRS